MEETYGMKDYSHGEVVRSVDPVCGREVVEKEAAAKTEWAGQTYYFCSEACQRKFEESPKDFAGEP